MVFNGPHHFLLQHFCDCMGVYASCSISPTGTRMSASMTSDCKHLCLGLDPMRERAERKDIDTFRQKSMTVVNDVQGHCAPWTNRLREHLFGRGAFQVVTDVWHHLWGTTWPFICVTFSTWMLLLTSWPLFEWYTYFVVIYCYEYGNMFHQTRATGLKLISGLCLFMVLASG